MDRSIRIRRWDSITSLCCFGRRAISLARGRFDRALAIREKLLGPDHPDTAASLDNLGMLLQAEGDFAGARPLVERALAIRERSLGPEHPDTAASLDNLGMLLQAQRNLASARPLLDRAPASTAKLGVSKSLVGEGNEVAHIDLLMGPRGSAAERAFANALVNQKDGFTTLLALLAPNLLVRPYTLMFNKVTIKDARQASQMFGPAQYGVAKAVAGLGRRGRDSTGQGRGPLHLRRRLHPLGGQRPPEDPGVQLSGHKGSDCPGHEG